MDEAELKRLLPPGSKTRRRHPERTREGSCHERRGKILREYAQDDDAAFAVHELSRIAIEPSGVIAVQNPKSKIQN
jgi:hypothetical protein